MIISLIGYRATGKSTVGQLLAQRLGWSCVDTDLEVQQQAGKSIREIFQQEGEPRFRDYEAQVIQRLTRRHKLVLAVGGGAVLREENRLALSMAGPVVWLAASPAIIRQRLQGDPQTASQRPALTAGSAADEIEQVLQARLPVYQAAADITIDTQEQTPGEIVERILAALDLPLAGGLS
jgi:shikimate kinase